MRLPGFSLLSQNYPNGAAEEVKALIGGHVNAGWITNTCVIRMSRALNYAGAPITAQQNTSAATTSWPYSGARGLRGRTTTGCSAVRSALRAWSRCHPVTAHNSSRIAFLPALSERRYRVAEAFVTALR